MLRRALRLTRARTAGSGMIAWGLGTEAPTRAEVEEKNRQNRELLRQLGKLRPEAPAGRDAGTHGPWLGLGNQAGNHSKTGSLIPV